MASKMITDRQKSATSVASAGETHAPAIGKAFAERYTRFLEKGEKMPDMELATRLVMRELRADATAMVAADDAHTAELADDTRPRDDRDTMTAELRGQLITLRGGIAAGYGLDAERQAGFVGDIPKDPVVLARFTKAVIKSLKALKLPKPLMEGINLQPAALAQKLEAPVAVLERHIDDVIRESREAQVTLSAKNQATDTYDDHFAVNARFVEIGLLVAGKRDLADRVRPSARRPGQTEGEGAGDGTGDGAPVAGVAAAGGEGEGGDK